MFIFGVDACCGGKIVKMNEVKSSPTSLYLEIYMRIQIYFLFVIPSHRYLKPYFPLYIIYLFIILSQKISYIHHFIIASRYLQSIFLIFHLLISFMMSIW